MRKKATAAVFLVLLVTTYAVTLSPVNAEPKTITVPDDYPTIQKAINIASAGDTVFVKKGKYNESTMRITKALSLIGEDPITTWINLSPPWIEYKNPIPFDYSQISHYDDAIKIEANDVRLSGFTITTVGGIYAAIGSRIHIIRNIVLDSSFILGGSNNVFALNTVTIGVDFFGSGHTIAGNTMVGGSFWIGVGCTSTVIYCNTLNGDTEGIAVGGNENIVINNTVLNSKFGVGVAADASNNIFYGNTVVNNTLGISIAVEGDNNSFYANHVESNNIGVAAQCYFPLGENNTLFRNSFVGNTKQVYTDPFFVWGDGTKRMAYHGGYFDNGEEGNYWSDYNGIDVDGDGLGDTPYIIDAIRRDNYPRMAPFDISKINIELPEWAYKLQYPLSSPLPLPYLEITPCNEPIEDSPPQITILSPINQMYNGSDISLVFAIDEPFNWSGYSLDGEENVTVMGNVTLTDLSNNLHNITVYANDTIGNMGASESIKFMVAIPKLEPELFPTVPVATVSIASITIAGVGSLVYFKKRKSRKD